MDYAHRERVMEIQTEAYLRAFEAIAPGIRVNLIGNGGQAGQILGDLLSLAHGARVVGEEVPAIGNWLNGLGSGNSNGAVLGMVEQLNQYKPFIQDVVDEMNPRLFNTLKVADLIERLTPVLSGREDLLSALKKVREDANFNLVGNLPVNALLGLLGINVPEDDTVVDGTAEAAGERNGKS